MTLLEIVKNNLDITADNTSEDKKLNSIIANAKQHLRSYAPNLTDSDFEDETKSAHFLLIHFCRYAYSNAAEMFDVNFKNDILAFRQEYEVSFYKNQNTD